jgi:hypothetical protein
MALLLHTCHHVYFSRVVNQLSSMCVQAYKDVLTIASPFFKGLLHDTAASEIPVGRLWA